MVHKTYFYVLLVKIFGFQFIFALMSEIIIRLGVTKEGNK